MLGSFGAEAQVTDHETGAMVATEGCAPNAVWDQLKRLQAI
jgi:hypothetical protein